MSTDSGFGMVRFFDDFLVDTINLDAYTVNTDGGGTAFAVNEQENGVIRCTTDGTDGDIQNLFTAAIWQPSVQGTIIFEARVAPITSLSQGIFVGLTDDNDTDEVPIDLDGGTLTTTATDAIGFCYDSGENGNWHCVSVKGGADGTQVDTGIALVAGTFQTLRVVVEADGNARFFINSKEVTVANAARTAAVTTTVQYAGSIAQLANGSAASVDCDYIFMEGGRA